MANTHTRMMLLAGTKSSIRRAFPDAAWSAQPAPISPASARLAGDVLARRPCSAVAAGPGPCMVAGVPPPPPPPPGPPPAPADWRGAGGAPA